MSTTTKTAKLFQNGRSQAVRLPAEYRFEGKEVLIRKDPLTGDVILSAARRKKETWKDFLDLAERLRADAPEEFDDFMQDRRLLSRRKPDPFA
jgi:antitoxin VapB